MSQIVEVFWELLEFFGVFSPEMWLEFAVAILVCFAFFAILLTLLHLPKWIQRGVGATVLLVGGWILIRTFKLVLTGDSGLTGPIAVTGAIFGMILVLFGGAFCLFPVSLKKIRSQGVLNNG